MPSHPVIPILKQEMKNAGWSNSRIEECIGCLWLIAAFVAYGAHAPRVIVWMLFTKAVCDHIGAIGYAIAEVLRLKNEGRL
jgi:hypothetical protein